MLKFSKNQKLFTMSRRLVVVYSCYVYMGGGNGNLNTAQLRRQPPQPASQRRHPEVEIVENKCLFLKKLHLDAQIF